MKDNVNAEVAQRLSNEAEVDQRLEGLDFDAGRHGQKLVMQDGYPRSWVLSSVHRDAFREEELAEAVDLRLGHARHVLLTQFLELREGFGAHVISEWRERLLPLILGPAVRNRSHRPAPIA